MSTAARPSWPRPRPVIGDRTSSAERASDPASWALPTAVQAALSEVIAARRDVRRFRPDPVSDELLTELLAAGHAAPSIGHSQPWRFLVVRDPEIRAAAAVMADRARLAQARQLDPDSARHLRSLQLEGIREAPAGVVVCCDRRARPAGVLGRATFPDADLWSCACAVQNIWLTARAHGLGLGWVTLFEPAELHALLRLPAGVQTLGWLCVGWPDERPPAPGLERHGWSRRLPLAAVTLTDHWPAEAPPPPVDRAATNLPDDTTPPRPAELPRTAPLAGPAVTATTGARVRERDNEDRRLAAPGSLGLLGEALIRAGAASTPSATGAADAGSADRAAGAASLAGTAGWLTGPGTLVVAAADHPLTALQVTAFPASTTALVARALAAGQGQGAALATAAGLAVYLADCGIDGGTGNCPLPGWRDVRPAGPRGDLAHADAMTPAAARSLLAAGHSAGRELAGAGPIALGEVGMGNTTVAAALTSAVLDVPAERTTGRGAGSDSAMVARKQQVITAALARLNGQLPAPGPLTEPALAGLIAGLGGPEQAFLTGVCLGAAQAGGLVVLDGLLTSVAALLAVRHRPEVQAHLLAGQLSAEPAHPLVLDALGLEPLLDLRLKAGEGVGAVLALSLLRQAGQARHQTAVTT